MTSGGRLGPLPVISIVSPTYNQGQYIEQTINSILDQKYPNLEYIIIDGGSTDKTVDIIKKYQKHLTYWVSEKDNGQVNAINKGLHYCTGEIFNWINSDDYLAPGALHEVAEAFSPSVEMVAGKVRLFANAGDQEKTIELVQHSNLSAKGLMYWQKGVQFVQPGVWMRRSLFDKCGGIDETLHYSFDWDLYIRYLSLFPRVTYTDKLLIHFRYHDQSKTVSMQESFKNEEWKIIEKLATQSSDKGLRRFAALKWAEKAWLPVLKENIYQNQNTKANRIINILRKVNLSNILLWRATTGAIKQIVFDSPKNL